MRFGWKWEDSLPFGAQGWDLDLVSTVIDDKMDHFEWHGPKSEKISNLTKMSGLSGIIGVPVKMSEFH